MNVYTIDSLCKSKHDCNTAITFRFWNKQTCTILIAVVFQSKIKLLSFIPGDFAAGAALFGTSMNVKGTTIALICGAILGHFSEQGAMYLTKITSKEIKTDKVETNF